jgi:hypothetical protein
MITTPFSVRHPDYQIKADEWIKWRDTMTTGNSYINKYLQKYSIRESQPEFEERKKFAPVPAFAKSCLIEIRNSIFKQLGCVERRGGSEDFQACMNGENFGVDLHGNSMNQFIGIEVLLELLAMARIGVYTDMPELEGSSLAAQAGKRPYYYFYKTEDILSWTFRPDKPDEYSNLILRDYTEKTDGIFGLPCGTVERIRHMWLEDGVVKAEWWVQELVDPNSTPINEEQKYRYIRQDFKGREISEPVVLEIPAIPFVVGEISDSLLADVANYQIALMNLNSSDIAFLSKAGYALYTEQKDFRDSSNYLKTGKPGADGTAAAANSSPADSEIKVGASAGRYYGPDMERPGFIHPSSEPIEASMAKQGSIKEDIRSIMNLSLSNVKSKMASQGSKELDNQGLDSGLAAIGLVLERMERKCAMYWQMYEGKTQKVVINYPENYSKASDEDKRANVKAWTDIRNRIPSPIFARWADKRIVKELLGESLSSTELKEIYDELDAAEITLSDPEIIIQFVEAGMLDKVRAGKPFGIPKQAVEDASKEHEERLKLIQESQTPPDNGNPQPNAAARGINDLAPDKSGGKTEKKKAFDQTGEGRPQRQGRGSGKNNKGE